VPCQFRDNVDYMAKVRANKTVTTAAVGGDYMMKLSEVVSREDVRTWMSGPLIDALAPECYMGKEIEYDSETGGTIAFVNNMLGPLRLQQTRFSDTVECPPEVLPSYPGINYVTSEEVGGIPLYPPCSTTTVASRKTFGDGREGFVHTPHVHTFSKVNDNTVHIEDSVPPAGHAFQPICGAFGSLDPAGSVCYGDDGGYVVDIFQAQHYRERIDDLIAVRPPWIDENTQSVSVHLNLLNSQTGCILEASVLFEFAPGGLVYTTQDYRPICQPRYAPDVMPIQHHTYRLLSLFYYTPFEWVVFAITAAYFLRLCFVQYKVVMIARRDGTLDPFKTTGYLLDLLLLAAIALYFLLFVYERLTVNDVLNFLYAKRIVGDAGQVANITAVSEELAAAAELGTITEDEREIAASQLKNAFFLSTLWERPDLPLNTTTADFSAYANTFGSLQQLAFINVNTHGLQGCVVLASVLKSFRYLQAWRPLATRYIGLTQTAPQILRFFFVLMHFQICFALQGHLLFASYDVDGFGSFFGSFLVLLRLLTGDVTVAKQLVDHDLRHKEVIGQIFVFSYMVIVVLTGSSLIISVLADGWENSTLLLQRRAEQKRELRELEKVQRDAEEYKMLKALLQDAGDAEIVEMADAHDRLASASEHNAKEQSKKGRGRGFAKKPSAAFPDDPLSKAQRSRSRGQRLYRSTYSYLFGGSREEVTSDEESNPRSSRSYLSFFRGQSSAERAAGADGAGSDGDRRPSRPGRVQFASRLGSPSASADETASAEESPAFEYSDLPSRSVAAPKSRSKTAPKSDSDPDFSMLPGALQTALAEDHAADSGGLGEASGFVSDAAEDLADWATPAVHRMGNATNQVLQEHLGLSLGANRAEADDMVEDIEDDDDDHIFEGAAEISDELQAIRAAKRGKEYGPDVDDVH